MAIPSVNSFANQPGGGLAYARGGINALANNRALRKYNEIKAEYAPETLLAQAASQAAYANNVGPQYIAKILQDAGFKGNTSDPVLKSLVEKVQNAGMMGNPLINTLNQRILERYGNPHQQSTNPLAWLWNKFANTIHPQQSNALINQNTEPMPAQNTNVFRQPAPVSQPQQVGQAQPPEPSQGSYVDENGNPVDEHGDSNTEVTPKQAASLEALNNKQDPSYLEGEATYLGGQEQGKVLGKAKADMQKQVGENQLALTNSGTGIDRLVDEFTNPDFVKLRNEFPYLQDMQIEAASHLNNPQIQHMIGQIKADIESFKGSTVMGFGGQTLKREFDYADQLKPSTKDTVYTASGKLETLKALHDIAYKKNSIINQLLKDKKMTPAEAVERANKMVDVKAIDKRVKELTAPSTEIENPETHATMWITLPRAKELGFTDNEIKNLGIKK